MEIHIRPLLAGLALGVAAVAAAVFGAPRVTQLITAGRSPAVMPAGTASAPTPGGGVAITYRDESLGWDWQVSCGPQFQQFLAQHLPGQPITSVDIVLVDYKLEGQLPFGTTYRGARTNGNCYNQGGQFACQVAVVSGEPGADLAVTATLNTPYTLLDMFLARGANPDGIRQTWSLATFQPLLVSAEEANRWQSSCLQLARAR